MGQISPAYDDRVRYTLMYKPYGTEVIDDPIGWENDDKEIARNEDYDGIITNFSNGLTFVGSGAQYILAVDEIYGVNANIRLVKEVRNPKTDLWERAYFGYLDLSTMEEENKQVKIKFNSGGIEQILKARESESVEIDRLTTMDGKPIDPIRVDMVYLEGREILLNTSYNIKESANTATVTLDSKGNIRQETVGVPLAVISQSHEEAQSVLAETNANEVNGTNGIMFFADNESERVLNITLDLSFVTNITRMDDTTQSRYALCLTKYTNGIDYVRSTVIELFNTDTNGIDALGGDHWRNPFTGINENPKTSHSVSWGGQIHLLEGESLALEFIAKSKLGGDFSVGHLDIVAESITGGLKIIDNSYYPSSQSKCVLAFELANKLIEIMTGSDTAFYSEFLGRTDIGYTKDGKGSLNGFTHGFWVRGFDSLPESTETNINSFKPLTTSWKDFMTSMEAIWNVGLGIETVGYTDRIVLEDKTYFWQRQVTVRLPNQITKNKNSVATKYYYSGLEFGYAKGGEYEEAMGLDEYNGKSTFTTVITRLKNTFSQLSLYRADSFGKEFARRKPRIKYPTEDSQYDNDIFIMDMKRTGTDSGQPIGEGPAPVFLERKWQDDFAEAPTGTYSPNTATNLRLSPVNNLLRHGWFIAAGFTKYLSDYVRYGSSTANSSLKTRLIGGNEHAENGNIINKELGNARFIPQFKEFEHEVTPEIMAQIEGFTVINGRKVPNVYGLFEFRDENNDIRLGYLINLKPNENKFKLLTANR